MKSGGPDFGIARQLCLLASTAYDAIPEDPTNPAGSFCVENFAFVIKERADRIDVAFQGTDDLKDIAADVLALFEVPEEVEGWPAVHRGFWRAFWACEPILVPRIPSGKPLYIGGHSLAGAMAKKAAAYLVGRGHHVAGVYTWGCPRGGGGPWVSWYNGLGIPTFDFIRGMDPIPNLPPYGEVTGDQIFLDARGRIIPERMKLPWWNVLGRLFVFRLKWHAADGYVDDMSKLDQASA